MKQTFLQYTKPYQPLKKTKKGTTKVVPKWESESYKNPFMLDIRSKYTLEMHLEPNILAAGGVQATSASIASATLLTSVVFRWRDSSPFHNILVMGASFLRLALL